MGLQLSLPCYVVQRRGWVCGCLLVKRATLHDVPQRSCICNRYGLLNDRTELSEGRLCKDLVHPQSHSDCPGLH